MAEFQERQSNIARAVAELADETAKVPTADNRRSRLEEIRDNGIEMLHHPDVLAANAWLRRHLLLYVRDFQVCAIEFLNGL
jgi:hypothetical protein